MCEAGVNVKVIQDTLGHKDISTTLNIYTDVTKELRRSEFEGLDSYFKNSIIKRQTFDVVLLLATKRYLHHLHQIQHQIARIGQ